MILKATIPTPTRRVIAFINNRRNFASQVSPLSKTLTFSAARLDTGTRGTSIVKADVSALHPVSNHQANGADDL